MPLQIIRQDITNTNVDAIVSAEGPFLEQWYGGVSMAIHRAEEDLASAPEMGGLAVGETKIVRAEKLPAKYIIYTRGPVWRGGDQHEREQLSACYRNSLEAAKKKKCRSVAFPLISSGLFGYPKDLAVRTAVDAISEFLSDHDMEVFLVVFDRESYEISSSLFHDIQSYIDETYEGLPDDRVMSARRRPLAGVDAGAPPFAPSCAPMMQAEEFARGDAFLRQALEEREETFSEMLLRKIDESGMRDAQCYRKANVDRRLFSKIRSNKEYQPSKRTALAFAVALELSLEETNELLRAAGYAISHSSKFDIIVEFFIRNQNYNIFEINEALFEFDQGLLGA